MINSKKAAKKKAISAQLFIPDGGNRTRTRLLSTDFKSVGGFAQDSGGKPVTQDRKTRAADSAAHYYNENDPAAAEWLRELIADGLIPPGFVDTRDIQQVEAHELRGYTQCHFFAGIGGWPEGLRRAGWPTHRLVWSGSCPCQPFSIAGKGKGENDPRHLWPELRRLIAECLPSAVFGEQVASKAGREWLAGVRLDLEELGYAVGAADLCAASQGAPHIRQRLFWGACRLPNAAHDGWTRLESAAESTVGNVAAFDGGTGRLGNGILPRLERHAGDGDHGDQPGRIGADAVGSTAPTSWDDSYAVLCLDGKARRVPTQPEIFPLAHGVPGRVGLLRGAGNAIVPEVAQTFIEAMTEAGVA